MVLPAGAVWLPTEGLKLACSQMRRQVSVALLKAAVGLALTSKVVALLMLLITVLAAKVPVPELTTTGIPTRRLAVVVTVTVVPLLLAP